MAVISEPLIFEILVRLPVKSLARFKCVNKNFFSLISNPYFVNTHLKRAKKANNSALLLSFRSQDLLNRNINFFTINDNGLAVLEYSVQVYLDSYSVLPSCNGLVCFYGAVGGIHVCNPGTKNIVKLPGGVEGRLLSCGFGFDQKSCTYKIVRISERRDSSSDEFPTIEIFTMGTTNYWRTVNCQRRCGFLHRQPPVFVSGFFYWIICDGFSGFLIASFDIGSEEFEVINPPESVSRKDWCKFFLEELGGELCLVDMDFESEGSRRMDIWLLKSGVSEKERLWIQETILHPSKPLHATRPMMLNNKSEILLHGFIKDSDSSLNWYNLQSKCFRPLGIKELPQPYFSVSTHVESLVPLNI